MTLDLTAAVAFLTQPGAAAAAGALVAVVVAWLFHRATARGKTRPITDRRLENAVTFLVAVVLTGASATGMWKFFAVTLNIDGPLRVILFAGIELALFAEALRARSNLRAAIERHRTDKTVRVTTGVDGVAVWVLAGLTGTLSALDADSVQEAAFRLAMPFAAAWVWERALAAEKSDHGVRRTINTVINLERVLVWLRLAEPTDRTVKDVDRARRIRTLARAAVAVHVYPHPRPWRLNRQRRRLVRAVEAAAEHIGLATDDVVRAAVRRELALRYDAITGTAPAALTDLNLWAPDAAPEPPTRSVEPPAVDVAALVDDAVQRVAGEALTRVSGLLEQRMRDQVAAAGETLHEQGKEFYLASLNAATAALAQEARREWSRPTTTPAAPSAAEQAERRAAFARGEQERRENAERELARASGRRGVTAKDADVWPLVRAWMAENPDVEVTRGRIQRLMVDAGFNDNSSLAGRIKAALQAEQEAQDPTPEDVPAPVVRARVDDVEDEEALAPAGR